MAASADACAARIMARQYGLITRRQAISCGLTPRQVDVRVLCGRWERLHPGVYLVVGAERSWRQEVLAACFSAGPSAAASHETAGILRSLIERKRPLVEVTVPIDHHPSSLGFTVHRSRLGFEPGFVGPVPTTSAARTLIDLAGVVAATELEEALDIAIRRGSVTPAELLGRVNAISGRRGMRALRKLLVVRAARIGQNDGVFATRFTRMLGEHGLPAPELEYEIRHRGVFVARVDICYPGERVAIELDGWERHSSPRALERDNIRQNAIADAGYAVRRFTWNDLDRPRYAVGVVRSVLRERGHPDVMST